MSCMQKYSTYSGRWPSLKAGSMRHMTHGRESRQCQLDWRRCASTPWCLESSLLRCLGQLQDSPAGSRSFRHRGRSCPGKEDSGVSCDSADETPSAGTATAAVRTTHTMVEELPHIGIRIRKGSTPAARLGSLVEVAGGKQLPGYTHQPMTAVNSTVKSFTSTPTCSHVIFPDLQKTWEAASGPVQPCIEVDISSQARVHHHTRQLAKRMVCHCAKLHTHTRAPANICSRARGSRHVRNARQLMAWQTYLKCVA